MDDGRNNFCSSGCCYKVCTYGIRGPAGPVGPTGPSGIAGPPGAKGIPGERGVTGPAGERGATGATGPQGPTGVTGPAGPAGEAGIQGLQGPTGPTGEKGEKGDPGEPGVMGPVGERGATGATGPQGATGVTGPTGPAGTQGSRGLTGPTGPAGEDAHDIFASFIGYEEVFSDGNLIILFPAVSDTTGNIVEEGYSNINLTEGYYLVSYSIAGILRDPGYIQVTPYYNGMPHLETGIYFATSADGASVSGSADFILQADSPTVFSLHYSGPQEVINGAVTITFLKLNRPI